MHLCLHIFFQRSHPKTLWTADKPKKREREREGISVNLLSFSAVGPYFHTTLPPFSTCPAAPPTSHIHIRNPPSTQLHHPPTLPNAFGTRRGVDAAAPPGAGAPSAAAAAPRCSGATPPPMGKKKRSTEWNRRPYDQEKIPGSSVTLNTPPVNKRKICRRWFPIPGDAPRFLPRSAGFTGRPFSQENQKERGSDCLSLFELHP